MKFKIGDKVRFKKIHSMEHGFLKLSSGEFHRKHEGMVAIVKEIKTYGNLTTKSKYNYGIKVDIDKRNRFLFNIERFEKISGITIDDDLFEL